MIHLICHYKLENKLFIVRPHTTMTLGFGGLNEEGLLSALRRKEEISRVALLLFDAMWVAYTCADHPRMRELAVQLSSEWPYLIDTVDAEILRQETPEDIGLPKRTLLEISNEFDTQDFKVIFREFHQRLPIYGFGDLQVLRLWKDLQKSVQKGGDSY